MSKKKNLFTHLDYEPIKKSKCIMICIGTPIDQNLKPKIKEFLDFFYFLKKLFNKSQIVIIRSSIFPGVFNKVCIILNKKNSENSIGRINITITNKKGSLNTLTQIIADFGGNITNLLVNQRSNDFFQLSLDIEVNDAKHLNEIITGLRTNLSIYEVKRAKENYN